ncbi:MAG: hypothetical protein NC048_06765 [Bacteroides sp.]|nr:hypothetical protein [Ruminococcus flavefaciens]MCM1555181.1 hypothetical protein [Bacteroides sp.]
MITSKIGRTFLNAYNKMYGKDYDAKTFFVSEFYPLFFDHPKYMMTAGNSPLENPKLSWEKMILGKIPFETEERRKERFSGLMEKIEQGQADASIAVGYPSLDINATTSGQVSNLLLDIAQEDIYLSWIGAGLGIGIQGGFSLLFDHPQILLEIFKGWKAYRRRLDTISHLKGNQINTWNGQWIVYACTRKKETDEYAKDFSPKIANDKEVASIEMQRWPDVIHAISKRIEDSRLVGYVYNHGQTNTTLGFLPFDLNGIKKPYDLYVKYFGIEEGKSANALWGTAVGFAKACQYGTIGIKAMEPKGLREYFQGKIPAKAKNEEQQISFNTYKIWIMAMLNNDELWDKSREIAEVLHAYTSAGTRGKTVNTNKVKAVLEATNKKSFLEALTEIAKDAENKASIEAIGKLVNNMPTDNVPYFLVLVRFHHAVK